MRGEFIEFWGGENCDNFEKHLNEMTMRKRSLSMVLNCDVLEIASLITCVDFPLQINAEFFLVFLLW